MQDVPPAAPGGGPTTRTRPLLKPGESFPAILARALRATGVEEALAIMARQGVSIIFCVWHRLPYSHALAAVALPSSLFPLNYIP